MMETNMRKQYVLTTEYLSDKDERVVTLLGDIGVYSFKKIKDKHPNQVHNLGILEPASIGIAAGLARVGYIPFFHTIAPFVVERPYEQLKVDFSYQKLCGNFVSVGASYDDGALGTTHYSPADVAVLKYLPNMQIVLPGTAEEVHNLICSEYDNGSPTYFRLSTAVNPETMPVEFGKAYIVKKGELATVVAVGPMLKMVLEAVCDFDVTVLYCTTIAPFDYETLAMNCSSSKVLLCEPFYSGVLTTDVCQALQGYVMMDFVGVPHQILDSYGTREENDLNAGITVEMISKKLMQLVERA